LVTLAGNDVGGFADFEGVFAFGDVREVELAGSGVDRGDSAGGVVIGVVEFDVSAIDGGSVSRLRTVPEMVWSLARRISMMLRWIPHRL